MSWLAVGSAVVGVASSAISARASSKAAKGAAAAGEAGAQRSEAVQREFFNRGVELDKPFRDIQQQSLEGALGLATEAADNRGISALGKIEQREGETAINRILKAKGLSGSGAGIEALSRFNERLLARESDKRFGRFTSIANIQTPRLAGIASNVGANIGGARTSGAAATSRGILGAGEARASFASGVGGAVQGGISNYSLLNKGGIFGGGGGGNQGLFSGGRVSTQGLSLGNDSQFQINNAFPNG